MKEQTAALLVESRLSKMGAVRWNNDMQVLYDYPSRLANPHFHFAFDAPTDIVEATQVAVTLTGRGNNFKVYDGSVVDLHLTPLGVFTMDGFAKFLEGMMLADFSK